MNERMTQLHVEAARYAKEQYPSDIVEWSLCLSEKFAELIVRECASELIKWKDEPFPYDPEFGARLIKQHFGVEE